MHDATVQRNFLAWTNLLISLYVVSMAGCSVSVELEHFLLVLWQFFPSCPSRAARIYLKNRNISTLSDVGFRNSFNSLEINHGREEEGKKPINKKIGRQKRWIFEIKQLPKRRSGSDHISHMPNAVSDTQSEKVWQWNLRRRRYWYDNDDDGIYDIVIFLL